MRHSAIRKVMLIVIRKTDKSPSLISIPLIGLFISILFIVIYTTIFTLAKTDGKVNIPRKGEGQLDSALDPAHGIIGTIPGTDGDGVVETLSPEGAFTVLAVASDEVSGLNDVVMLVAFYPENMRLNIVQIPRDTYFRANSRTYRKINGAASALGGIEAFAKELGKALGINIDYTVQFNLNALAKVVDLVGGVPINLPYDMDYDDPDQGLFIHLKAGDHVLDGDMAIQFVRFRSGYIRGDIARIDAQKIFMAAFIEHITKEVSLMKIPGLIAVMLGDIKTNMSFSECISFAQSALSLRTENVRMVTISGEDTRTQIDSGAWYYIINRESSIDIVNRYLNTTGRQVTDDGFDPDRLFTDDDYPHYNKIYYGECYDIVEYRADDINKNGIGIGMTGD